MTDNTTPEWVEEIQRRFGLNPATTGLRPRSWWIVTDREWEEESAGDVRAGDLCVSARDGASNPIDADACRRPNFVGTAEYEGDRTYRYYYFAPLGDERCQPASELDRFRADLLRWLDERIEEVDNRAQFQILRRVKAHIEGRHQ